MIKFIERIFAIPVIIVLEALLLVANLMKILTGVVNDMMRSAYITLGIQRDHMMPEKKDESKDDSNKN